MATVIHENEVAIESASPAGAGRHASSIGAILVEQGVLTSAAAEQVCDAQRELGIRFGEAALQLKLISKDDLRRALAKQYDFHVLQPGLDGRLERLVLVDGDVDRDVRVLVLELLGDVLPQRETRVVVLDVPPLDGHRLVGARLTGLSPGRRGVGVVVIATARRGDERGRQTNQQRGARIPAAHDRSPSARTAVPVRAERRASPFALFAAEPIAEPVCIGFKRRNLDMALIHGFDMPPDVENRRLQSMRLAAGER